MESAKYPVVQSSARAPPQILLHDSLWRSASQLKIIDTFLATYLPNSEPFSTEATKYSIGSWVNVVLKLYKQSDLVRLALIANGLGIVGKQNRQPSMNLQGLSVYGQALNKLGLYLKSPQFTVDENLMVVPMLLCLFEVGTSTCLNSRVRTNDFTVQILLGVDKNESIQFQRWSSHMAGVTSILTLQHPEYYASGMAHELFVDLRVYQVSRCSTRLNDSQRPLIFVLTRHYRWSVILSTVSVQCLVFLNGRLSRGLKFQRPPKMRCWIFSSSSQDL